MLSYFGQLLCLYYKANFDYSNVKNIDNLKELEVRICTSTKKTNHNIFNWLISGNYRLKIKLKLNNESFNCELQQIELNPIMHYIDRILSIHNPNMRIVDVEVDYDSKAFKYNKFVSDISQDGFKWLGHTFYFMCSKIPYTKRCYFLQFTDDSNLNERLPNYQLFQQFGDFTKLKSISSIASRCNLLFSKTFQGLHDNHEMNRKDIKIKLLDDISVNSITSAEMKYMTDGSGFISADLAMKLPRFVSKGQLQFSNAYNNCDQDSHVILPACFQVRVVCAFGIFKGTLVVSHVIASNSLVLRKSMLKVPSSSSSSTTTSSSSTTTSSSFSTTTATKTNSSTFYVPRISIDVVATSKSLIPTVGGASLFWPTLLLNRHLILLLHHCGVPLKVFDRILR
jgi:hypothetical protein